LKKLDACRYWN